ncbi:MAG: hypothetical protein K940chlam3_00853 [Chlamydiae bacterium]|nr:hypothetical protein [Chlamydiota bacterium]
MTSDTAVPYEWLKSIDPELLELDSHPLFGFCPAFPWEKFSQNLAKSFDIESLEIKPGELRWREKSELFHDLGDNLHVQQVTLSTIDGTLTFVIDMEDLRFLMFALLQHKPPTELMIYDQEVEEGFYRYLALETVRCFCESDFDKTLNPHLLKETSLPEEASLGWDIQISILNRTAVARLFISPEFQKSFKTHYAERTLSTPVSQELLKKAETTLHLEVGKVNLSQEELKELNEGDLVLLDQCYVDPEEKKGQVILTLNGIPKIRASFENNTISVMETPLFHEDISPLVKEKGEETDG